MGSKTAKQKPEFDANAYGKGYEAYCGGLDISENPYGESQNPNAHHSWEQGWRKGRTDDDEECERLKVILAEAEPQGMTQADLLSKLDYLEVPRLCFLLDDLTRRGHVAVSENDGTQIYRRLPKGC